MELNPERVSRTSLTLSGLIFIFALYPQGSRLRSNPGLELANAFGVINSEYRID
jgi:hypothetical protein